MGLERRECKFYNGTKRTLENQILQNNTKVFQQFSQIKSEVVNYRINIFSILILQASHGMSSAKTIFEWNEEQTPGVVKQSNPIPE